MHIYERVRNMVTHINQFSDMGAKINDGTKIQFTDLSYVQPEVLEFVTRTALANGIQRFQVEFHPKGGITIIALTDSNTLCHICGGVKEELQDDGVCVACRDPNVEPGEQAQSPIGAKSRSVMAKFRPTQPAPKEGEGWLPVPTFKRPATRKPGQ